jgi:DNA (cytosine-5)-methyltransferase 1
VDYPVFPPGPGDAAAWRDILERWPWLAPAVEPGVRGVVDGTPLVVDESRADQLRAIGNGVVPLQAAVAVRELLRRIG